MSDVTCRGSFALGTACRRCSKCKAEIEEYEVRKTVRESLDGTSVLKMQVTGWQNVAQVNGAVADQAKAEVARLTDQLATARRDALEEAAEVCEKISNTDLAVTNPPYEEGYSDAADACFHAIRALMAQEEPTT